MLIVDDESLARIRLQRLLEKIEGVEIVGQAANGADAVTLAGECLPDIVLMDIRMPVLDGIQAAERISAMTPPPAVIFCTAFDDFALRAFDAQASAYLLKPVNAEELAQAEHYEAMMAAVARDDEDDYDLEDDELEEETKDYLQTMKEEIEENEEARLDLIEELMEDIL